jgi:hypothetical protein
MSAAMTRDDKVVDFPNSEERARRLKVEVERLARQSSTEWLYYIESPGYPERFGVDKATLRQMIEAAVKAIEKKAREDRGEARRREDRVERQREASKRDEERRTDREERERARRADREERERERREREERKAAERKTRQRVKALAAIVKLPRARHEAELKKLARSLDEDVETLRLELDELLGDEAEKIRRGIVEPWDEQVNTRELLDAATAQIAKYVIIHDKVVAPIVPLWIAFAWVHDVAVFSPLLNIQGSDTEMAKSALTEVISRLTPRGYMVVKPTGPVIYRLTDYMHPTLCIDDADKLLAEDRDLAAIIRASWKRGVYIPRTVKGVVYLFDAFGPRCLNGIDLLAHLDPATRTRCITVRMLPKLEGERGVTSLRYADGDENFVILRRKFLRWATDNMATLKDAKPRMPDGFFSRLEENYHLLFAIADLAGGDWPKKARAAAVRLARSRDLPSLGKRLLAIFYDLFVRHGSVLTSKRAEALVPAEDDEFADYKGSGRPITRFQIAALLRVYPSSPDPIEPLAPGLVHPRGGHTADRGWHEDRFAIAFKHFLGKTLPTGRSVVRTRRRQRKPNDRTSREGSDS